MAVSLKHAFQSAKSDGPDNTLVQPSDWNAEHTLTQATGKLLGRTTAGTGATEEITPGAGLTMSAGTLSVTGVPADSLDSDYTDVGSLTLADTKTIQVGSATAYSVAGHAAGAFRAYDTATQADIQIARFSANSSGPAIRMGKSRGGTLGAFAAVQNGDDLGALYFAGSTGSTPSELDPVGASIVAEATATWTGSSYPTRITFSVTPSGSTTAATALSLEPTGKALFASEAAFGSIVQVGYDTSYNFGPNTNGLVQVSANNSAAKIQIARFSADTVGAHLVLGKSRNAAVGATSYGTLQSGDEIGSIQFAGSQTSEWSSSVATIRARASQNWTNAAGGSELVFFTAANGGEAQGTALLLGNDKSATFYGDIVAAQYIRGGPNGGNDSLATATGGSGFLVTPGGQIVAAQDTAATAPLILNKTNGNENSNVFIRFRADGSDIDAITGNASGVIEYTDFCGVHRAEQAGAARELYNGTVLASADSYMDDGRVKRIVQFKVSDRVRDKAVYGVFQGWGPNNKASVAALGIAHIRIRKGAIVYAGDLLESAGDGTAVAQEDDVIRSSTIGKVLCAEPVLTYPDGSYLVSCALYCG